MMMAPGRFSKHELMHSLKSLFSGSTVGRITVQSDGFRVGSAGTGVGSYKYQNEKMCTIRRRYLNMKSPVKSTAFRSNHP